MKRTQHQSAAVDLSVTKNNKKPENEKTEQSKKAKNVQKVIGNWHCIHSYCKHLACLVTLLPVSHQLIERLGLLLSVSFIFH